jgi:hypothetical protein
VAEHGTRSEYVRGCRCDQCRAANAAYYHERKARLDRGEPSSLNKVDAGPSRRHLKRLKKAGIGTRMVHELTGCNRNILVGIRKGRRKRCLASTEKAILGVTIQAWGDAHLVDAAPTWELLDELINRGWTKTYLARELGSKAKTPALQVKKDKVTALTELKVRRLFNRLMNLTPPPRKSRWNNPGP